MLGESRKRREGLTLIELMVVLAVMGVLVSAALPAIGDGFADRRVAIVARDVVSLFQRARYMSNAYGRAHQVYYVNDTSGLGDLVYAFETHRGTAGACALSTWENDAGRDILDLDCESNWRCVDALYSNTYDSDPEDLDDIRVDGFDNSTFCYEAGALNQIYRDTVLFSNWQNPNAQAGFGFVVFRNVDGDTVGVARKVLVPFGTGSPRVMR